MLRRVAAVEQQLRGRLAEPDGRRIGRGTNGYSAGDLANFMCFTRSQIQGQPSQWQQSDPSQLIPFGQQGGNCLTNSDPAGLASGGKKVTRCPGATDLCCDATKVGQQAILDDLNKRNSLIDGSPCGPNPGTYSCSPVPTISESDLNAHGFENAWSYQYALASSGYCSITPLVGTSFTDNKECSTGLVCCKTAVALNGTQWCTSDTDCPSADECDLTVKQCVPRSAAAQKPLNNCVDFARTAGETGIETIVEAGTEDTFSCQLVATADSDQTKTACLIRGCEAENSSGNVPDGSTYRCCKPNTGLAPSAVSGAGQTSSSTKAAFQNVPGSIQWLPCIATGSCSLDEIVASGAAFANFLIAISGSVFLAIFVYAGFLYLTAGSTNRVEKAKTMLQQATIGMVLLLGAFVFVRFIQQSFISNSLNQTTQATKAPTCGTTPQTANYACTMLSVDPTDSKALKTAISDHQCVQGLCPDNKAANWVCCPQQ